MNTVRTTSALLHSRLGEPSDMEMDSLPNATIMMYKLKWDCGCKAEGSTGEYVCRPCPKHVDTFSFVS